MMSSQAPEIMNASRPMIDRGHVQSSDLSAEQHGSAHDLGRVERRADDEPERSEPDGAFTASNRLDVAVDVEAAAATDTMSHSSPSAHDPDRPISPSPQSRRRR